MPKRIRYSREEINRKFMSLVDKKGPDDCWLWLGGKLKGYGFFSGNGTNTLAHIFSYNMHNKISVPKFLNGRRIVLRHKCNNRPCVNPNHLLPGTYTDNSKDRFLK